jgi:hypothetical protein
MHSHAISFCEVTKAAWVCDIEYGTVRNLKPKCDILKFILKLIKKIKFSLMFLVPVDVPQILILP